MSISKRVENKVNQLKENRAMKNLMLEILKAESNGAVNGLSAQAAKTKYIDLIDQYLKNKKGGSH